MAYYMRPRLNFLVLNMGIGLIEEREGKDGSFSKFACDADLSFHLVAALFHDGEAEAVRSELARRFSVHLIKSVEDFRELVLFDADPGFRIEGLMRPFSGRFSSRMVIPPRRVSLLALERRLKRVCRSLVWIASNGAEPVFIFHSTPSRFQ